MHFARSKPYAGVVPGMGHRPPGPRASSAVKLLTWPGFQMNENGTSRVFVQLTAYPDTQTNASASKIHVWMKGVRIGLRNNRRPLDTRFFQTPVKMVRAVGKRDGVHLMIDLKRSVEHKEYRVEGKDGKRYLCLEFPAEPGYVAPRRSAPAPVSKAAVPPRPSKISRARPRVSGKARFSASASAHSNKPAKTKSASRASSSRVSSSSQRSSSSRGLSSDDLDALVHEKPPGMR